MRIWSLSQSNGRALRLGVMVGLATLLLAALLWASANSAPTMASPPTGSGTGALSDEIADTTDYIVHLPLIMREQAAVSYSLQVQPLFNANCIRCHGDVDPPDELSLTSYEKVMAGGDEGPVVIPGDPANSELVKRIKGLSQPRMPLGGPYLSNADIQIIETWVALGAQNN